MIRALCKGIAFNHSKTLRCNNIAKICAFFERIRANGCDAFGYIIYGILVLRRVQNQLCLIFVKQNTVLIGRKCTVFLGNRNISQLRTECVIADLGQVFAYCKRVVLAIVKCPSSDFCKAFGKRDIICFAAGKGKISYRGNTLCNPDIFNRPSVFIPWIVLDSHIGRHIAAAAYHKGREGRAASGYDSIYQIIAEGGADNHFAHRNVAAVRCFGNDRSAALCHCGYHAVFNGCNTRIVAFPRNRRIGIIWQNGCRKRFGLSRCHNNLILIERDAFDRHRRVVMLCCFCKCVMGTCEPLPVILCARKIYILNVAAVFKCILGERTHICIIMYKYAAKVRCICKAFSI